MRSDAAPALPATLPALSGVNLTNLNGSNIASGTVSGSFVAAANLAASGNGGVTGTLGAGNGGTGITALGSGVATALGNTAGGSGGFALESGLASYLPLAGGTLTGVVLDNLNSGTPQAAQAGTIIRAANANGTGTRFEAIRN